MAGDEGGVPGIDRALLWAYLGHPADEPRERRRVLYGLVALRLGLGLSFALRGWGALFAAPPGALASRLGDLGALGLASGPGADMALFVFGCTEILVGLFFICGAFSRLAASVAGVLLALYLVRGIHAPLVVAAELALLGGALVVVVCGGPFLSADRFLDKVEEEERDRAPAVLPAAGTLTPLCPRLGLAAGLGWLAADLAGGGLGGAIAPGAASLALAAGAVALALALLAGVWTRAAGPLGALLLAGLGLALGQGAVLVAGLAGVAVSLALTGAGTASVAALRAGRSAGREDAAPAEGLTAPR
ncbi:MAG TPA: DoxX family protein [Thermomicrobiales bacterium]|nr:DoxX family protein [Thermomicrobiales bacterium]